MNGFLYVMREGEALKVGYSARPTQRLEHFQSATWRPVELVTTYPGFCHMWELSVQQILSPYRIRGEWYHDCPEVWSVLACMEGVQHIGYEAIENARDFHSRTVTS